MALRNPFNSTLLDYFCSFTHPIIIAITSGGPFGIEDIVRAGGPFYALLGFSLLLVWAVPEALITAELSTAMPEARCTPYHTLCHITLPNTA